MKSFNEVALVALAAKINRYLFHSGGPTQNVLHSVVSEKCNDGIFSVTLQVVSGDEVLFSETIAHDANDAYPKIDTVCNRLEEQFIRVSVGYFLTKMLAADPLTRAVASSILTIKKHHNTISHDRRTETIE